MTDIFGGMKGIRRIGLASRIGRAGLASEKDTAKLLGGRQTPASGALAPFKGDIETARFLIEAKSTVHNSLTLKLDWLLKIKDEARSKRKRPALTITFTDPMGKPVPNGQWVAIPLSVYRELVEEQDDADQGRG